MPPLRRYLRITQYSVLECRIYLDNSADLNRWLLNASSPVLPRVVEAVRPLVLPKLREENARAKAGKAGKKKGWKDVVVEDDFEVAVFLTEASARHAILRKEKKAKSEKARLGTKEGRLTGPGTRTVPLEIGDDGDADFIRDESPEENEINITDIPAALDDGQNREFSRERGGDKQSLALHDGSQAEDSQSLQEGTTLPLMDNGGEDDKKMALNTMYDGFWIYGRILCLVVKRRGVAAGKESAGGAGQAMMEEWIASTQMGEDQMMGD
ncbi:hypothetical protein MMC07_002331 [Pseudocyphellaria aurata]|nr:hypothetical protein [Pseudocyphellaria aurata]